jgi:hypothetical protein
MKFKKESLFRFTQKKKKKKKSICTFWLLFTYSVIQVRVDSPIIEFSSILMLRQELKYCTTRISQPHASERSTFSLREIVDSGAASWTPSGDGSWTPSVSGG